MGTRVDLLRNVLNQVKENLELIQNERSKLNDETSVKAKKRIADGNFQKIITLKNDDMNTISTIKKEILELDEEDDDVRVYKDEGFDDKINEINMSFDQTFAVVDQMKRETELLMNNEDGSNEFEDENETFSIGANKSNEFFKNNDDLSNGCGEPNAMTPGMTPCKLQVCVFSILYLLNSSICCERLNRGRQSTYVHPEKGKGSIKSVRFVYFKDSLHKFLLEETIFYHSLKT